MSSFLSISNIVSHLPASGVTITIPTPPRLRTMLKEELCIEKWSATVNTTCAAPGHIPWGIVDLEETEIIPEYAKDPPDAIQNVLSVDRHRRETGRAVIARKEPVSEYARSRCATKHESSSFRNALVFEREITLKTGGETKRWSLHVPASTMNPDMVDMMLELRHLKSFFKEEPEEAVTATPDPPFLMVSNSHFTMPLSLPSTGSMQSSCPTTLAVRRGNRPLPPLLINSGIPENLETVDPYPDILTTFLGTPSYERPPLEYAGNTQQPPANFNDMIYDLRSRCAPLQVKPSTHTSSVEEGVTSQAISSSLTISSEIDEWGFAQSIMQKYGDAVSMINPAVVVAEASVEELDLTLGSIDHTLVSSPLSSVTPPFKGLNDAGASNSTPDQSFSLESETSLLLHPIGDSKRPISPSSPTPSARSDSPSSGTPVNPSPRGILKRCKSVRFAESPITGEHPIISKELVDPSPSRPLFRRSVGSAQHKPLKRPSPLRSTFTPQSNYAAPLSHATLPGSSVTPSLRAAGRQKSPAAYGKVVTKPPKTPTEMPVSSRSSISAIRERPTPKSSLSLRPSTIPASGQNGVALKQTPVSKLMLPTLKSSTSPPRPTKMIPLRTSSSPMRARAFTTATKEDDKSQKEKENRPKTRASLSVTYTGRRALDENTFRRGSVGNTEGQGSSRMPVPLRKIFTRFK
ncbi:hypothetical protein Moror_17232 [Moniliophthora roreri MCA 2997]|uniref:Uncharacterized protein n=2 Tax=Moniliophthora roreri TaxID=221103 RepID=V2XF33_MONRO|nr:hypothetical protein Moror_17232 [Moniliophthora roreri MCA 2997]